VPTATSAQSVDRSTLPLSKVARHVVVPEGIVDSLWFDIEPRVREFGVEFDTWQDGLSQVTLGLRADGTFAATVGGVTYSIPRQVAKTFIVMVLVVALATMFPNLTILWTAHRTRTASQTFQKMQGFVKRKALRRYVKSIRAANGEQEIRFTNDSVIMFGAREQGFGRGFDEVDIEVFDEAQILTEKALEDMVAATNQSRWIYGALLFFMGTPPRPADPGEEFTNRRAAALAVKPAGQVYAEHGDALYVECSADPECGKPGGPSLDDREQVKKANPSYPHRTPDISVQRLRKQLTNNASYRREGLGIWDEDSLVPTVINIEQWSSLSAAPPDGGRVAYGVKFSNDGERVALSVALRPDDDGPTFVEVVDVAPTAAGTAWLVDWLSQRWRDSVAIVIDGKAGAGGLEQALVAAKVSKKVIVRPTVDAVITAHAGLLEAIRTGGLTHAGQPGLTDSVKSAGRRPIGTGGGWGFTPITDGGDVTPIESVTMALHGVMTSKRKPGRAVRVVVS